MDLAVLGGVGNAVICFVAGALYAHWLERRPGAPLVETPGRGSVGTTGVREPGSDTEIADPVISEAQNNANRERLHVAGDAGDRRQGGGRSEARQNRAAIARLDTSTQPVPPLVPPHAHITRPLTPAGASNQSLAPFNEAPSTSVVPPGTLKPAFDLEAWIAANRSETPASKPPVSVCCCSKCQADYDRARWSLGLDTGRRIGF